MIKIKSTGGTKYIINGYVVAAKNYKDALTEYLSIYEGGAKPIFT